MWQRKSMRRDSQQGGQQVQAIFDNSGQIEYNGAWVQNYFVNQLTNPPTNETSHSTGQPGSLMFVAFNGSQINATGTIPAGDGAISANYIIDNSAPITKVVDTISQANDLIHQTLFISPVLEPGHHNLTIQVIETGSGRNYTFQQFNVTTSGTAESANDTDSSPSPNGSTDTPRNPNTVAIVGGVLASVVVLLLVVLFFWRRKRPVRTLGTSQRDVPPMYYARPLSSDSLKVPFSFDQPSVLDTDSKFTFAVHNNVPTGTSRRSWVTVDRPPTIPHSALLSERDLADWSTYKGSSVICQPPPQAERSHFSPYTSRTLASMAFSEATPRLLSRGADQSSLRRESQPSAVSMPTPYGRNRF